MMEEQFINQISFERNAIQLIEVELWNVLFSNNREHMIEDTQLDFELHTRTVGVTSSEIDIFLLAIIGDEEKTGFSMHIEYRGRVNSTKEDILNEELEEYAQQNIIPMLLPYIREISSALISRTKLPTLMLPTLDVINHIKNRKNYE